MRMPGWLAVLGIVHVMGALVHAQPVSPPAIGLPLPSIGLPLPAIGLPPQPDPSTAVSPTVPPPPAPLPVPPRTVVYFGVAPPAWGFAPWQQSTAPGMVAIAPTTPATGSEAPDAAPIGRLRLELEPKDAQLFIDGEFVGTWADHGGLLELAAGTRRLEVRAAAHEPLRVDIRIVAGRDVTYRADLQRVRPSRSASRASTATPSALVADPPAPEPAAAVPPAMFYLIPGCYLGNVPPDQVKLPADCDLSRMITHTPRR